MSVLKALFEGRLFPIEYAVPKCQEYAEARERREQMMRRFYDRLDENGIRELEELEVLFHTSSGFRAEACFIAGFKLGARIMMEVFEEETDETEAFCTDSESAASETGER